MDKYEFNIKLDQIKELVEKKDFNTAAAIAKEMEWHKVKDWTTLSFIINVHETVGDIEEARDIAILAYNRNLGGRRLVYKLTELFVELGEYEDAESLYKEYARMSRLDVNKYTLLYKLKKAQETPDSRLIEILEEYKEHEIDEKYLLELAELYSRVGRIDDCIKECEEIALWFQEGEYVEQALNIKQRHAKLTVSQQKILDNINKKKVIDEEKIKQQQFAEAKKKAHLLEDEIEDAFRHDEKDYEGDILGDEEQQIQNSSEMDQETQDNEGIAAPDFVSAAKNQASDKEGIAKAEQSLRELILNAKKKIENNYEMANTEIKEDSMDPQEEENVSEEEDILSNEEICEDQSDLDAFQIPVDSFSLYDTQNIQDEIAKNLDQFLKDNPDEDLFKNISMIKEAGFVPQNEAVDTPDHSGEDEEDEQIEGQLSLADWIEEIREKKYGKQNTKEFSKAELDRLLEEREYEKEEYERLLQKQRQQAEARGELFHEEEAKRKAQQQIIIQSAQKDLAIRTGKATARLEAEVEGLRQTAILAAQIEQRAAMEVERISKNMKAEADTKKDDNIISRDVFTSLFEKRESQKKESEVNIEEESAQEQELDMQIDAKMDETAATEFEYPESQKQDGTISDNIPKSQLRESSDGNSLEELPKNIKKIFKKYEEMPGLEEQLVEYFNDIAHADNSKTSHTGNIIISGNRSSDKTSLAVNIIKAFNLLYPQNAKRIAKTTGESVNHKGILKAMSKLRGTALIIEDAGVIEPKRIKEILEVMERDTGGMLVIFEDSDTEINVLLSINPDIGKKFNYRIVLKQYTVNELVEMAKKYAQKRQHGIDDNALLQLYLKIDRLHAQVEHVRLDQIKEIIDRAILKAEKRASKRFFGTLKKKRGNNGDVYLLSELDFKD